MSRQVQEIELLLRQLIDEHRELAEHVEAQQQAMHAGDAEQIDRATHQQQCGRTRIARLESRRRQLAVQIGRAMRLGDEPTLPLLAQLFPARSEALLALRDELRTAIEQVSTRTHRVTRLASAVLGHLNSAVRLIAGAVEQAGVYTKSGSPQMTARIGVMEAVG
jgi:hypothetical protein